MNERTDRNDGPSLIKYVRFDPELVARIQGIAEAERRTFANTVEVLVAEALIHRDCEAKQEVPA